MKSRFPFLQTIAAKVTLISVLVFIIMGCVICIAFDIFDRVELFMSKIAHTDVPQIVNNAQIGRDVTLIFTGTSQLIAGFLEQKNLLAVQGEKLVTDVKALAQDHQDAEFKLVLQVFGNAIQGVLDDAEDVADAYTATASAAGDLAAALGHLETTIDAAIVRALRNNTSAAGLKRQKLDLPWFRETLLRTQILLRQNAHNALYQSPSASGAVEGFHELFLFLHAIEVKLCYFQPADIDIVKILGSLMQRLARYKDKASTLQERLSVFQHQAQAMHISQRKALAVMAALDQDIARKTEELHQQITTITHSSRQMFIGFTCLLVVVLFGTAILTKYRLLAPLHILVKATGEFAQGNWDYSVNIAQQDEFGQLAKAATSMAEQLKKSFHILEQKNSFIQALIDAVPTAVFFKDRDGRYLGCNRAFTKFVGKTVEEIQGKTVHEVWPSQYADTYHESDLNIMKTMRYQTYEYSVPDKDSIEKPVIFAKAIYRDESGGVAGLVGSFLDITERKKAEEDLRHLRNYLANIINSMPSVLIGVDNKGIVSQWNKTAEEVTGVRAKAALGRIVSEVCPAMASQMDRIFQSIQTSRINQEQKKVRHADNQTIYEDITIYPLITNGVEGAVIRVDDVTEKVRLEEMMVQSEKMISVGGLAAGMAHEINNPLAGMIQSANVMKSRMENMDMPANVKVAEELGISMADIRAFMEKRDIFRMINAILESGARAAEIVGNMLSLARQSNAEYSSHHPDQLMDAILELAATDYDLKKQYDFKSIEIVKEYADDLPMIPCESPKIQQVVLNILRNGAQAMQEAKTKSPQFILRIYVKNESEMVCIEIEDNGPGMDEETRLKVFDPFFTTKPVGIGTGLGLSVSYFIITKNHHGSIDVISGPGQGAKFIICLPLNSHSGAPIKN